MSQHSSERRRSPLTLALLLLAAALLGAGFAGLGVWQVHRLAWKRDLIARVDARVHAAPVPAPGPAEWRLVTAERDEYRRVSLDGHYVAGRDSFVVATTRLGGGYCVLSPFIDQRGFVVLVNRGFVAHRGAVPPSPAHEVVGLLRITEPGGTLIRSNDPAADRWVSRDVQAIAAKRGLGRVAPYFIDAEGAPPSQPVGGLTVIAFPNNHLVYAITWFALALLVAFGAAMLVREARGR